MKNNTFNRRQFITTASAGSLAAVISNTVPSFGNTTKHASKRTEATWVKIKNEIYGAKADERGPIGGGNGYKNIITKGDYTVTDVDGLLDALTKVKTGQVIFIPSETLIDLTTRIYIEELTLNLPEGVTLAGDRGYKGSKGALLSSDSLKTPLMIKIGGPSVRITGLRIQGPNSKLYLEHHRRSFSRTGGLGSEYYYKFPVSRGITTAYPHLEVDNCELSAFSGTAISLSKGNDHYIHHNFIHQNQYAGLGYGVSHGPASSLIEYNLFDSNRHSIAGSGVPGCGYIARHNVDLFDPHPAEHCFDMHGGKDRKDGTDIAGTSIEIYNNTFGTPTRAIGIRGVPEDKCEVHNNWFQKHDDGGFKTVQGYEKTRVFNNVYGDKLTVAK